MFPSHQKPGLPSSGFWHCSNNKLDYLKTPLIMGVLNVTPDSFSDGGDFLNKNNAIEHALRLQEQGADIIDIGGESTRPGAKPVFQKEEEARVLPIIEALTKKLKIPLSIDTKNSITAENAILAGAAIVNDVTGLTGDPQMASVIAKHKVGVVIMHSQGRPETMQDAPSYKALLPEIHTFLKQQIQLLLSAGVSQDCIAIDPGIGFGKTLDHNLSLIHHLSYFQDLGVPTLLGPSRKSFIGKLLDLPADERLEGTAAAIAIAVFQGARILRVHDVKLMRRVIRVAEAIRRCEAP